MRERGLPFILRGARLVVSEGAQSDDRHYDSEAQLWMDASSGKPLIRTLCRVASTKTNYGETVITRTAESTDQTESVFDSKFGETLATATREGTDESEVASLGTECGETILTKTREGTDQTETSAAGAAPDGVCCSS